MDLAPPRTGTVDGVAPSGVLIVAAGTSGRGPSLLPLIWSSRTPRLACDRRGPSLLKWVPRGGASGLAAAAPGHQTSHELPVHLLS